MWREWHNCKSVPIVCPCIAGIKIGNGWMLIGYKTRSSYKERWTHMKPSMPDASIGRCTTSCASELQFKIQFYDFVHVFKRRRLEIRWRWHGHGEGERERKKRINLINRYIWDSPFTSGTCHDRSNNNKWRNAPCTESRSIIQFSIYENVFRFSFHSMLHRRRSMTRARAVIHT